MSMFFKVIITLIWITISSMAMANDEMDALLGKVKISLLAHQSNEDRRLAEFVKNGGDKRVSLAVLRRQISLEEQRQEQLLVDFNRLQTERSSLSTELSKRSVELKALFSFARKHAAAMSVKFESALSSARYPQRWALLAFAHQDRVPQLTDLQTLWLLALEEMTATAGVQRYKAPVIANDGSKSPAEIVQLGTFVAMDQRGQYLRFNPDTHTLQVLGKQRRSLTEQAKRYVAGVSPRVMVDPLKGKLLDQQSRIPSFAQRLQQGGLVGYIILCLGTVGILIAIWRVLYMALVSRRLRLQLTCDQPSDANPLGRVLNAARGVTSVERAELLIDKAMLKEIPQLERCHSLVKLLAAVAPLLGLLGTVTGMIETFQSITLLGTSDPKLMAGGISQALITTVMGLCVAIPLLF